MTADIFDKNSYPQWLDLIEHSLLPLFELSGRFGDPDLFTDPETSKRSDLRMLSSLINRLDAFAARFDAAECAGDERTAFRIVRMQKLCSALSKSAFAKFMAGSEAPVIDEVSRAEMESVPGMSRCLELWDALEKLAESEARTESAAEEEVPAEDTDTDVPAETAADTEAAPDAEVPAEAAADIEVTTEAAAEEEASEAVIPEPAPVTAEETEEGAEAFTETEPVSEPIAGEYPEIIAEPELVTEPATDDDPETVSEPAADDDPEVIAEPASHEGPEPESVTHEAPVTEPITHEGPVTEPITHEGPYPETSREGSAGLAAAARELLMKAIARSREEGIEEAENAFEKRIVLLENAASSAQTDLDESRERLNEAMSLAESLRAELNDLRVSEKEARDAQFEAETVSEASIISRIIAENRLARMSEAHDQEIAGLNSELERVKAECEARIEAVKAEYEEKLRIRMESGKSLIARIDELSAELEHGSKLREELEARIRRVSEETSELQGIAARDLAMADIKSKKADEAAGAAQSMMDEAREIMAKAREALSRAEARAAEAERREAAATAQYEKEKKARIRAEEKSREGQKPGPFAGIIGGRSRSEGEGSENDESRT